MEHFSVVQSIIRAALASDRDAVTKQVGRLRARLAKAGSDKEAQTIDRLLKASADVRDLEPSHVEVSRAQATGEVLTPEVHPPIDRETGARLCSIEFPDETYTPAPIYSDNVMSAIGGVLAEWSNIDRLRNLGVEPTRSLLIFGPPGSGKTMTARFIANKLALPLITARIDGLVSSFLGTTARNIANLFDFANRYTLVLLLDEFDALAKLRDDPQEIGEIKRVVNTLLQNLDLRRDHGVTIAITNHDRLLDPAVWRRFETQIHMDSPEYDARAQLIERFIAPIKVEPDLITLFSYCLDGLSGADLERTCRAVKRVIAVSGDEMDSPNLFQALASVLAHLPSHDHPPANHLARNLDWFVSYAANDKTLKMTQDTLGHIVGKPQYQISRLKSEQIFATDTEVSDAQ